MQDQLIDIQLEEREQDINKLVNCVQEVSDLFTDVSL
jgi:t-SNARE complex subunit (syntaxin)